jgi:hypothetical protein
LSVSLPARPISQVVAGVAAQAVGEFVAGQRGGAGDGEIEVLDVGREGVLAAIAIDAVVPWSALRPRVSPAPR